METTDERTELVAALNADCQRLANLLSERRVPKPLRKAARALLREAFAAAQTPDADLVVAGKSVDAVLRKVDEANPFQPRLIATPMPNVVRIGAIKRQRFARAIDNRWSRRGDRLDAIVDWFWQRCKPDDTGSGRPMTAREQALDEFGEDMEYVWGKRGRRRE